MSTDNRDGEENLKRAKNQQDKLNKDRTLRDKNEQDEVLRKTRINVVGHPEFLILKPEGFDRDTETKQKFIANQEKLYNDFKKFIQNNRDLQVENKKLILGGIHFDQETGSLTFSSIETAAKFVELNPDTKLMAICNDRDGAFQMIRKMQGLEMNLGVLKKLNFMDNGRMQTLEGSELENFKNKAKLSRPSLGA
jgi:hypothetical protein